MRIEKLSATFAVAAVAVTLLAAPARADDQLDQAFLTALRDKGVTVEADAVAVEIAQSTCDRLNGGGTVEEALRYVKRSTEYSDDDTVAFAGLAVYAYCRDKLPQ